MTNENEIHADLPMNVEHAVYFDPTYGQWGAILFEAKQDDVERHALIIPMRINEREDDYVFRVKTQRKATKRVLAYTVFRTFEDAMQAASDEADLALFDRENELIRI